MSYRCCATIQNFAMNIMGRLDTEGARLALCCEPLPETPGVPCAETAEASLQAFMGEGLLTAIECARNPEDSQRHFTAGCVNCAQFQEGNWQIRPQISYVNLAMCPAPCQSQCIYCVVPEEERRFAETARANYEKVFDILEMADRSGAIAPGAIWQVSSGEIAIHPYHDRIMKLVAGKRAIFYSNCMKYDEDIAQNLHDTAASGIDLSIDCGTAETWKKVKGLDNFDRVLENLVKYHAACSGQGQIHLKYIILPDINDIYEDYLSLMEIMKALEVKHLSLSRDVRMKYDMSEEDRTKLTGAASYLLALCHKNGITNDMLTYSQDEQAEAIRLAREILQRGLV